MTSVNNILRSVHRLQNKNSPHLNVLTLCKNTEKYIALLCKTNHSFYIPPSHKWNNLAEKQPSNLKIWNPSTLPYLDYIICYDRAEQYEEAQAIAFQFHIPIILVDMCTPSLLKPHHVLEHITINNIQRVQRRPALQICNTEYISESWGQQNVSMIIPIGIDTNIFQPQQNPDQTLISIDNNTAAVVGSTLSHQLQGRYPILPVEHDHLDKIHVNMTQYYLNTNKSVTISLLQAMAAGNITISLRTNDTERFIDHNKTGILVESINDFANVIASVEQKPEVKKQISQEARQQILKNHSVPKFINKWSTAFNMMKSVFYTPLS